MSPVPVAVRVLLAAAVALLAVYALRVVTASGGPPEADDLGRALYASVKGVAVLALLTRAVLRSERRAAWALLGTGLALSFAGDVTWMLRFAQGQTLPGVALPELLFLVSYPPMLAGAACFAAGGERALLRGRRWADGPAGALALATVLALLLAGPLRTALAGGLTTMLAVQLVMCAVELGMLAALVAAAALRGWSPAPAGVLLGAGAVLQVGGDALLFHALLDGTYVPGRLLDLTWPAAAVAWALAAWAPATRVARRRREAPAALTPVLFGLAAAVAFLAEGLRAHPDPLVVVLAFLTVVAVLARFALTTTADVRDLHDTRRQARTDPLTALANRRSLDADLAAIRGPHVLVLFDLDGFKRYNDTFGHPAGDALLRAAAGRLRAAVGPSGRAYRLGGDEFCALVPAGDEAPSELGGRLSAALAHARDGVLVTATAGAAAIPGEHGGAAAALEVADRRLYAGKRALVRAA